MRKIIIVSLLLINCIHSLGQIKNPGFENIKDTVDRKPENWNVTKVQGFVISVDHDTKFQGLNSLSVIGSDNVNESSFAPFSQILTIDTPNLRQVSISAYIKTKDIKGSVGLWCQILDKKGNIIGFQNSQIQNVLINGTNDWSKYKLSLSLDTNAKRIVFGGYLQGFGSAWFDNFKLNNFIKREGKTSKEVVDFLTEVIDLIKEHSIVANKLNWSDINENITKLSLGLNKTQDAQDVLEYILNQLKLVGDNHSLILSKEMADNYARGNNAGSTELIDSLVSNNIGYIKLNGFSTTNVLTSQKFASKIQNIIRRINKHHIKGWIIDLRNNSGGNMYPEIAGLGPLLGNGVAGYFVRTIGGSKKYTSWSYNDGKVYIGKVLVMQVKDDYKLKNSATRIAILIGNKTSSSGEMIAVSFKNKKNTRFFGQASGGYLSANQGYKLSNGDVFYLASGNVADRNKNEYDDKLIPEILIDEDTHKNPNELITVARNWILRVL
ncbi:peptidase S41-like protein [Mucilaginibacter gracilis]|uniref:Peptidase S41-like protein n=1 Tax=Mucilaginibacter gracilis TaxID=423350 RepID=A0A495J852_9SPHI|nr:S41 family peptidase [Mucilaginibacter gracilis]RKR85155.1 peptidase S41-like protein [Mucilaginibacter gracilis]